MRSNDQASYKKDCDSTQLDAVVKIFGHLGDGRVSIPKCFQLLEITFTRFLKGGTANLSLSQILFWLFSPPKHPIFQILLSTSNKLICGIDISILKIGSFKDEI